MKSRYTKNNCGKMHMCIEFCDRQTEPTPFEVKSRSQSEYIASRVQGMPYYKPFHRNQPTVAPSSSSSSPSSPPSSEGLGPLPGSLPNFRSSPVALISKLRTSSFLAKNTSDAV
eukprot:COSAG06_NODE_1254_length_10093_cov_2.384231_2_plen_114_part_00